ncbi:hypothetical protein CsSME_00010944 [Camellia sinensis var. sinensis]
MGACFSDAKGGQMAVGGAQQQTTNSGGVSTTAGGAAHNDAVDFFLRTKGLNALFTQIEVYFASLFSAINNHHTNNDPLPITQNPNCHCNPPLCCVHFHHHTWSMFILFWFA